MNNYRVLVNVENVLTILDGQIIKVGFYTTRYVSAADDDEAGKRALNDLCDEKKFRDIVLNESSDPPNLLVDEVEKLGFFYLKAKKVGYAFYRE